MAPYPEAKLQQPPSLPVLPSILAHELEQVAADAIRTAFHPTTPGFEGLIERFLADRPRLLKGPFLSLHLPFHKGQRRDWFPEFQLPFQPWRHQEQAFARLSPGSPQNTLVATGTGSGKTECFLLPCLEHCRLARQQGQAGIKVLILYPMNALATDQAKRIAQLIHATPALAGLRAGLYIGDKEELSSIAMGPEQVITDRATLHKAPPDLLLTNYKQLDYLLLQPQVQGLWAHNGPNPAGPSVLRYLVVDEFHTFDGAQGTDLACLIRRLRDRLSCQGEQLLCVGTSATLGDRDAQGEMVRYATQIFGSPFSPEALIQESRQSPAEFFQSTAYGAEGEEGGLLVRPLPTPEQEALLDPATYAARHSGAHPEVIRQSYLLAQVPLWLGEELPPPANGDAMDPAWRIALGRQLGRLPAVQNLILQGHTLCSFDDLLERFARQLGLDGRYPLAFRHQLLASLLALLAHARGADGQPWLQVRVQLWLRELKRMVASVAATPELLHSDDLLGDGGHHLPVVHCRDCGATGWASTLLNSTAHQLDPARNLRAFYRAFFARDPLIRYVFPQRPLPPEAVPLELATAERLFCQDCLTLQEHRSHSRQGVAASPPRACQSCSSPNLLVVRVPETTFKDARHHLRSSSDCPFCQAPQSLLLIGASAASLTSACASALFASSFNTDRKLLTFSDSVQDAAHRAGFIAARAYRTSFRTALTRTLQAAGRDLSLPELQEALLAHWHQALPDPVDFVATFLPTDMEWLKDWAALEESRQPSLAPDSPLVGLVEKRLRWEVIAEFGYRSRLGSSVEQAGALAATSLAPERLESVLLPLLSQLRNEVEALRGLEAPQLRQALVGWLHHLRQRGALPTPELLGGARGHGSRYLSSLGTDTFGFKLLDHLPNFGPTSNRPLFLASSGCRGPFETLASRKGRPTWAMAWLARATGLPEPAANQPAGAENLALALRLIVEALEASGLLLALPPGQGGERLWGLDPALVRVSASTTSLRCDTCQDGQTIPRTDQALWEAMPCLVAGCGGHYRTDLNGGLPLYRRLYRSGAVRRILAREHTGLLPRADRERLEFQFIHDGPLSHPNLLSATSTLEMGINIGDLSSLLLCSVPPEPANYLQRIGRAGRRDGQSLVATIVNATPHDLYFYGEPKAMLQGRVSPPGCYLDAAAILARQLVAFSLDRWVQSGLHPDDLPRQLKSVLDTLAINNWEKKQQRFPFTWLRWTRDHQRALLSDFLDLFAGDTVGAACRDQLAARFLAPEPEPAAGEEPSAEWVVRLLDRLEGHNAERKRLNREGTALNKRRLALEAIPPASRLTTQSEDLEAIQRELEALGELRKALENRPLLQDLTDGGLLPNYAFPEEGVTLQSVLWRRLTRKNRSGRSSETLHPPSYERPGSVAIRELVPEGVFYAQGRRLRIDQIDLSLNPIQRWRFCRACSTCLQEGEEGFHSPICPGCGDANFSDLHQVKEMARLRQVIASGDDALSRISDDRDDRTPTFFQRQLLVIPDLQRVEVTLAVNDGAFPFGVEYIAATTFREINFGALNPLGSGHQIAGQQFRVRGFELCSACGKVLKGEPQSRQHAYSCRYREDPENAKARQLLFLYRDFRSEALRFLLPDRLFWDEAGQSSFQAALGLGLKRHFSGRVDHLQATIATEPQPGASPATGGSQQRKTFLYLYDSVPGGTGYLRQLVEEGGERLRLVLAEAAGALQACSCHDGCYRCLYAYRRRFERERTSKARALEQWQLLSEHWPKLQNSTRGLTSLTITTQLESELEERFLDALREGKGSLEGESIRLTADTWKGKAAWRLQVGACGWILQTQVELGAEEGVAVPSRCDFLLTPTAGGLPVAVYTDGWEFHHDRLALDARQRLALQRSGRYRFWSLTWADVVEKPNGPADPLPRNGLLQGVSKTFQQDPAAFAAHWLSDQRLGEGVSPCSPDPRWLQESNSLQWLLAYLRLPSETQRRQIWQGLAHTFCLAQGWKDLSGGLPSELQARLEEHGLLSHLLLWREERQKGQAGAWLEPVPGLLALNVVDLQAHQTLRDDASLRALHLPLSPLVPEPEQPLVWREWLRQGNLFQFLPHMLLTTEGFSGFDAPSVPWTAAVAPDASKPALQPRPAVSEAWSEALTFAQSYAPAVFPLLSALQPTLDARGIEPPEFSHEVTGARGATIAELPLAWPGQRVAVVDDDAAIADLHLEGWRFLEVESTVAAVLEALTA